MPRNRPSPANEAFGAALREWLGEKHALQARIFELEAALDPFARVADSYLAGGLSQDMRQGLVTFQREGQRISLAPIHFRDAAKALGRAPASPAHAHVEGPGIPAKSEIGGET